VELPVDCFGEYLYWRKKDDESDIESSAVPWRPYDEEVDDREQYSTAVISPLFTELCSGRLEYPLWRVSRLHEMPLESDALVMLAYYAIATGIGRCWNNESRFDEDALKVAGLGFLEHLFEQQILSPTFLTHLAFGGEFGLVRIAAGDQRLSIWQHFSCWWAAVAATSGDFEEEGNSRSFDGQSERSLMLESSKEGTTSVDEQSDTSLELDLSEGGTSSDDYLSRRYLEQYEVGFVLECFITNGADIYLALKIEDGRELPTSCDDMWLAYTIEMIPDGGNPLELEVVVNLGTRLLVDNYPYRSVTKRWEETCGDERVRQPLPSSTLSVRDWIDRSRPPNKHALLRLIDENREVEEADALLASDES
jgi:hypothetical protein